MPQFPVGFSLAGLLLLVAAAMAGLVAHGLAGKLAAVQDDGRSTAALPGQLAMAALSIAGAAWASFSLPPAGAALGCLLAWILLVLGAIDLASLRLPDLLTLPLAAIGLVAATLSPLPGLADAAWGLAAGYSSFGAVALAFRRLRGRDGLGMGDAKLLGAAGAWVGWQGLPSVVLIGAATALAWVLVGALRQGRLDPARRYPFGPFLCLGLWFTWTVGPIGVA